MEALVSDIEKSELDHINLFQRATVIWDGPTHNMSSLSKAVTYVVENIPDTEAMDPLIAISEEPYLLEKPQIQHIYEKVFSAASDDESDAEDAVNGEA